jgi:hypothetical protein
MYIEKNGKITVEQVIEEIKKSRVKMEDHEIKDTAECLVRLNDTLLRGGEVWATCLKEPRNLDSGCHYYSIHFINDDGKYDTVWLYSFGKVLGGTEWSRNWSMPKYLWKSRAIGMSRLLDATDGVFSFLRRLGGCYAQINTRW